MERGRTAAMADQAREHRRADRARPGSTLALHDACTLVGSIRLVDGLLCLRGEIDTELCENFTAGAPELGLVQLITADQVTFMGCRGLGLMVQVARLRGGAVALQPSAAVRRVVRLTGVAGLFAEPTAASHPGVGGTRPPAPRTLGSAAMCTGSSQDLTLSMVASCEQLLVPVHEKHGQCVSVG